MMLIPTENRVHNPHKTARDSYDICSDVFQLDFSSTIPRTHHSWSKPFCLRLKNSNSPTYQ